MLDRSAPGVTIRPAQVADAEAILELHQASIRELASGVYSPTQIDSWARKPDGARPYEVSIRDDTRHVVVGEREIPAESESRNERAGSDQGERPASRDGDLAGWGRLDANDGEVSAVYVHPDHVREGVGSAILARLERVAREVGLERLHLWASLNAVPFYEAAGYAALGETLHETSGGVVIECVEMEKELG